MKSLRSRPDLVLAAGGLFLLCWGLVHLDFWSRHAIVDWTGYEHYGDAILHQGLVPYRDFAVEYPPAALVSFLLPAAFSRSSCSSRAARSSAVNHLASRGRSFSSSNTRTPRITAGIPQKT